MVSKQACSWKRLRRLATWSLVVFAISMIASRPAWAYKPQSPEVQALVRGGISFIEQNFGKDHQDAELGAFCICGLACFSHTGNPEHPMVQKAIAEIRRQLQQGIPDSGHSNYSLGIALILLGSIDPAAYSQETQALLQLIYQRQMQGGAWSYPGYATGDTSQTQFACLGTWMAHKQGVNVPIPVVERVTNWLIRTQAPDGSFGYQGKDPGGFTRVPQERTTSSMGVAGTGSLYVVGELLGFIEPRQDTGKQSNKPNALKQVKKKKAAISANVEAARWMAAIKDGDSWVDRNAGVENIYGGAATQQCYYMYTMERYWAFRDLATANPAPEPAWYNRGVDYLRGKVAKDGGWTTGNTPAIDTAFAVLFLLRSSQKTVQRIVEESGALIGGKTLPDDLTDLIQDKSGKVISAKETPLVEDILSMLEDPNSRMGSSMDDMADQLELAADPAKRSQQIARLRRMAVSGPFSARLTAVKALSRIRDLDNAPALIYAVTDPDTRVSRAASNALRFLSRKLAGPMVPEEASIQQKNAAAEVWKQWYLSIRPDGALIE